MQKQIELKPIKESTRDYEVLETQIRDLFKKTIFLPMLEPLGIEKKILYNSIEHEALLQAIRLGRVTFNEGVFSGRFNSSVSRDLKILGARWDRKSGTFRISQKDLPIQVRAVISTSEYAFMHRLQKIDEKLAQLVPEEIAEKLKCENIFDRLLFKTEKDFKSSVSKIGISPTLSDESRKKIASEWETNMRFWVKKFTEDEILKLRHQVKDSFFKGDRYGSAVKMIQDSFQVSANKAKFLARQETHLLMTQYKQSRYVEAGVKSYRWRCVKMPHDRSPGEHVKGNVRYSHGQLDGKVFSWDNPPVTSEPGAKNQRRNNPGQDYNCRCFAIPIVQFK